MLTLQHIKTGEIIKTPTIADFARRKRWGKNGTFHFDLVLKGKRLHHKGWGIPSVLDQEIQFKDVYGNTYTEKVRTLASRIGSKAANDLRKNQSYQDLLPKDYDISGVVKPKDYTIKGYLFRRGTDGHLVRLNNLKEAPEKLGVSYQIAYCLSRGLSGRCGAGVQFIKAYTKPRKARAAKTLRAAS